MAFLFLHTKATFMRGRLASAIMRKMNLPDLVATSHQEFIQKAIDLASDGKRLKKLRSEIPKRIKPLFRDDSSVVALKHSSRPKLVRNAPPES